MTTNDKREEALRRLRSDYLHFDADEQFIFERFDGTPLCGAVELSFVTGEKIQVTCPSCLEIMG